MKNKTVYQRVFTYALVSVLLLQCLFGTVSANEVAENINDVTVYSDDYTANGYDAPITLINDVRPGDTDGKYLRVSGLETYASGIVFEATNPDFTLDTEKTYRLSVWLRTMPDINNETGATAQLNLRIGGGNPLGIFGWAGVNFNLSATNAISDTWTEYYAIFQAAAPEETTVEFYRDSNSASVIPFDIDGITFTEVQKNDDGEWVPVDGAVELVNVNVYREKQWQSPPKFTVINDNRFSRIDRVDGINTAISPTSSSEIEAGKYTVSGKFRLGEFDYDKVIYNASIPYNADKDNNQAQLSAKIGTKPLKAANGADSVTVTNDWTYGLFTLDISERMKLSDITFSLNGAYMLEFCDISVDHYSEYITSGYNSPIVSVNDAYTNDSNHGYYHVENTYSYGAGILFYPVKDGAVLDPSYSYKLSFDMRAMDYIGEAPEFMIRLGGERIWSSIGWDFCINSDWKEYSMIFAASDIAGSGKALDATVGVMRSSNLTDAVPFDIDNVTLIALDSQTNQPIDGKNIINDVYYESLADILGKRDSIITVRDNIKFNRVNAPDTGVTAFGFSAGDILAPGQYEIKGKFRLGEYSQNKIVADESLAYNVAKDNNTAVLTVSGCVGSSVITNRWLDVSFVLDTAEPIDKSSIVFSLDGAYKLDFYDLTVLPLSAREALPEGNVLDGGDFNSADILSHWNEGTQDLFYRTDANGGYLETGSITICYEGFLMTPVNDIPAGAYRFTGLLRTAVAGEKSQVRLIFTESNGQKHVRYVYLTNDWIKIETYINLTSKLSSLTVCGGAYHEYIQAYCMDNFSLVHVSEIPGSYAVEFGERVTPEEAFYSMNGVAVKPWNPDEDYEINGLMINHDCSAYFSSFAAGTLTVDDIVRFCKQFKDTHVTDYFINVDGIFPSDIRTSALEFYYLKEHCGEPVDFSDDTLPKSAHYMYEVLGADYIGIWCETFTELGINPWISFRMNDVHDLNSSEPTTSKSEFWYKNPEFMRVKHHSYVGYMDKAFDYTYREVREYMLLYINEALNRYDSYGIELDFQRELNLFHIGGEYSGLDIMNQFMREVDDLVAIYEEKYGHEIKIAVRVAPDVMTCYEFGLDVITWAAEGIVQLVSPTGRFESHCTDMPIKMWSSILKPYNVTLAPCIDFANLRSHSNAAPGANTIETLAATAAYMYSQGADKMYTYNYFLGANTVFAEADKVNSTSERLGIYGEKGLWNVFTSLGSYEKINTYNRRCIVTYNDMHPVWRGFDEVLPLEVSASSTATLRIPVGDILDNSTLTVEFSTDNENITSDPPTVYANNARCSYVGAKDNVGSFTDNILLCYNVPSAAYSSDAIVIDIISEFDFEIDYAEVYIKYAE